MCKYCKTCGKSDFGYTRKRVTTVIDAVRVVNGDIVEIFEGSEETNSTEELTPNYCFTCNKEITAKDLVTTVSCPICGKKVDHLTDEGICEDCSEEAARLSKMSQNELILELLKKQHEAEKPKKKRTTKTKENAKTEETVNVQEKNEDTSLQEAEKIVASKVETDDNKDSSVKKTTKVSREPVPVDEKVVQQIQQQSAEQISSATAESVNADNVATVSEKATLEELNNIERNTNANIPDPAVDTSVPVNNVSATVPEVSIVDDTLSEINAILGDVNELNATTESGKINRNIF